MQKHPAVILVLVLAALLLGIYWHTLFGHSVHTRFALLDDSSSLKENPHLAEAWDVDGLGALVARPYFFDWTPLYWAVIWVQRGLFGNSAVAYRAVSLVAFLSAMFMLFGLMRRWSGSPPLAALLVLLLAAHPLVVESLAWPTTQKTVLSLLLAVASLSLYDRMLRSGNRAARLCLWCAVAGLVVVSFGIKLRGLTLPFCLAAYDLAWSMGAKSKGFRERATGMLCRSGLLMTAALLWALYNQVAVFGGSESGLTFDTYLGGSFFNSIATHAVIEWRSLLQWFWPGRIYFFYAYEIYGLSDWEPWAAGMGVLGVVGLLVGATPREHRNMALFGACWYLLQRALTAGVFPHQWGEMCNRYALVASVGLVPLLGLPLLRVYRSIARPDWRRCLLAAAGGVLIVFAMQSWILSTRYMTYSGLAKLSHPDSTRVRFRRLMQSRGNSVDVDWARLRDDLAAPTAIGWIQLARAAAHWGQDRYARGFDPPDDEVLQYAGRVPLPVYRHLVLASYYAATDRPDLFRTLLTEALDIAAPRLKRWMVAVESDLRAGRERDWYQAYLRVEDGVARRGELEEWSKVLPHALELLVEVETRRQVVVLGCGINPEAPFWRRQWAALDDSGGSDRP